MIETKHTPGPWQAWEWRVCNVPLPNVPIKLICDTANNKATRTQENAANARLIAAAPELLAACKRVWERLDNAYDVDFGSGHKREYPYSGAGEDMELLDRIIAKAEGRNG